MRHRLLAALAPAMTLVLGAGCSALLGIPSEAEIVTPLVPDGDASRVETSMPDDVFVPPSEAGLDGGADADADAEPPPSCDLRKEFAAPELITTLSTAGAEGSPKLSDDELTMYFDAVRAPESYFDLYMATRTALTDSFGPATLVAGGVNTTDNHEYAPNVSSDGLTIFFERQDPGLVDNNFWFATRTSKALPFETANAVSGVNTPQYEGKLNVRGDGSELYFIKLVANKGDIFVAKRMAGGSYVTTPLTSVNSPQDDYSPVISKNGLVLYLASKRSAAAGGGFDIWVTTRGTTNDNFSDPVTVLNVNTASDEEPSWVSNDGCRLYLRSNRPGGLGGQDIYVASRPK